MRRAIPKPKTAKDIILWTCHSVTTSIIPSPYRDGRSPRLRGRERDRRMDNNPEHPCQTYMHTHMHTYAQGRPSPLISNHAFPLLQISPYFRKIFGISGKFE